MTKYTNNVTGKTCDYEVNGEGCNSRRAVRALIEKTGAKVVKKFEHWRNGKTSVREIPAHQFQVR